MKQKSNGLLNKVYDSSLDGIRMFTSKTKFFLFLLSLFIAFVPAARAEILFWHNFDNDTTGLYDRDEWLAAWVTNSNFFTRDNDHGFATDSDPNRRNQLWIVADSNAYDGKSLRMTAKEGQLSGTSCGWDLFFPDRDEIYTSMWLKFDANVGWQLDGKLPLGIASDNEHDPTGGAGPHPNGFTGRLSWKPQDANENGNPAVASYNYHPDMVGKYGESFYWNLGGQAYWVAGQWAHFEHRVKLNTPGQNDGIYQCWLNGRLVVDRSDMRWVQNADDTYKISQLLFYYFWGGSGDNHRPLKDEYLYVDNVVLSTERMGPGDPSPPTCDASHLDLCSDQTNCEAATGIWCTDVCQSIPCGQSTPSKPAGAIEMESGTLSTEMEIVPDAEATGGFYIQSMTNEAGSATHTFNIDSSGSYKFIARVYATNTSQDSLYFHLDNQDEDIWDFNPTGSPDEYNVWREDEITKRGAGSFDNPQNDPYVVVLSQGQHTLTIRGREAFTKLDYFYVVKVADNITPAAPSALRVQAR